MDGDLGVHAGADAHFDCRLGGWTGWLVVHIRTTATDRGV